MRKVNEGNKILQSKDSFPADYASDLSKNRWYMKLRCTPKDLRVVGCAFKSFNVNPPSETKVYADISQLDLDLLTKEGLHILIGNPQSGKSTFIENLVSRLGNKVCMLSVQEHETREYYLGLVNSMLQEDSLPSYLNTQVYGYLSYILIIDALVSMTEEVCRGRSSIEINYEQIGLRSRFDRDLERWVVIQILKSFNISGSQFINNILGYLADLEYLALRDMDTPADNLSAEDTPILEDIGQWGLLTAGDLISEVVGFAKADEKISDLITQLELSDQLVPENESLYLHFRAMYTKEEWKLLFIGVLGLLQPGKSITNTGLQQMRSFSNDLTAAITDKLMTYVLFKQEDKFYSTHCNLSRFTWTQANHVLNMKQGLSTIEKFVSKEQSEVSFSQLTGLHDLNLLCHILIQSPTEWEDEDCIKSKIILIDSLRSLDYTEPKMLDGLLALSYLMCTHAVDEQDYRKFLEDPDYRIQKWNKTVVVKTGGRTDRVLTFISNLRFLAIHHGMTIIATYNPENPDVINQITSEINSRIRNVHVTLRASMISHRDSAVNGSCLLMATGDIMSNRIFWLNSNKGGTLKQIYVSDTYVNNLIRNQFHNNSYTDLTVNTVGDSLLLDV